ncbi:MAG: type II toxin-antitoxin system PemK/MazF family toxin [Deltaproteobacteria bacterium]|nr:type II toxin-antitoxin system PemK/MazF family toxin [Deltaproteobacteria bacterium]
MVKAGGAPDRGEVVWLSFDPQVGHEKSGHRLALTISPKGYNTKVGLALFCQITTQVKGYPFEVAFPPGGKTTGVVLSNQIKSLDWKARRARRFDLAPPEVMEEVLGKILALVGT